jgi:hypothetical protein
MYGQTQIKSDKNHRAIPCDTCPEDDATMLQAYVDDEALALNECEHIDDMLDSDIRGDGIVEGHCEHCNGADDGDCDDGEEIREPA